MLVVDKDVENEDILPSVCQTVSDERRLNMCQYVGFSEPIFMRIFDLRIKNRNGYTGKFGGNPEISH